MEKVSVYLTTHNRLEKLKAAVKSVLNQDYENIELLICDDGSTDGTKEWCSKICNEDLRIKYLRNDSPKGACNARNMGIKAATGTYITGLDDDDEFLVNRISIFIDKWDGKYSFICADFYEKYSDKTFASYKNRGGVFGLKNILIKNEASNQIFTLTSRLKEINGFKEDVRRFQDWDTWIRLVYQFGSFMRIDEATYIMNHGHSENEKRVSKSYPLLNAYNDLLSRNKDIYDERSSFIIRYIISEINNQSRFLDSIKASFYSKSPKFFLKKALNKALK